ncbi:ribonuclease P protein subunit Rpp21 [Choristoneura fumiferana]|uniref:ribonuclease P protein subunit Rpp21 n=1 Tax=Choristoneura fumiferana TaxID=7141 RepID=UPI003D15993C
MKKVQGNDSFQRINYLYQISKLIVKTHPALSSYYGNLMVNVAKKNVLKMHPDIKRQICKKCRCTLILGQTATMKIKHKQKHKTVEWTCNTCNSKKCFLANGKKEPLWLERPEAVVEVINLD